ncbi:hypothetical protein [Leptolyngbya sp. ST-U4]|uniref:hypothetical protein n=1 Tax=Leptolyngbya sp. ST-U4 TaxID=2933912 RepID=UPI00329A0202
MELFDTSQYVTVKPPDLEGYDPDWDKPSLTIVIPRTAIPTPEPGTTIATRSGSAVVTRTEVLGIEPVIWANYGGAGVEQPHTIEDLLPFQVGDVVQYHSGGTTHQGTIDRLLGSGASIDEGHSYKSWVEFKHLKLVQRLSPEQPQQGDGKRKRRYSPKGKAVGWIEERKGNLKRKNPSVSYYYCWMDDGRKRSTYIPVSQIHRIRAMVDDRCSGDDILAAITKQPKPHCTETSKP